MTDAHLWACGDCGNVYATDHMTESELPDECGICGEQRFKQIGGTSR